MTNITDHRDKLEPKFSYQISSDYLQAVIKNGTQQCSNSERSWWFYNGVGCIFLTWFACTHTLNRQGQCQSLMILSDHLHPGQGLGMKYRLQGQPPQQWMQLANWSLSCKPGRFSCTSSGMTRTPDIIQ